MWGEVQGGLFSEDGDLARKIWLVELIGNQWDRRRVAYRERLGRFLGAVHLRIHIVDEAATVQLHKHAHYFVELQRVENPSCFVALYSYGFKHFLLLTDIRHVNQIEREYLVIWELISSFVVEEHQILGGPSCVG